MNNARKPLIGVIALSAAMALAMPMAFAQEADEFGQDPAPQPTEQPAGQVTWADLDTDGDGNLSRDEAAALPELAAVFDQADTDGDGVLTPEEYQAFAASQGAGAPPQEEPAPPQDDESW